jgi:hypothetical protein
MPDNASGITYNFLDTNDFNGDGIKDSNNEANQQDDLKPLQPLQNMAINRFQIMLHDLINKHKASLQMYDKIYHLVIKYASSPNFNCHSKLRSRKSFLKSIEDTNQTHTLRPTNVNVQLHSSTLVAVPVFDIKEMTNSMLMDNTLMTESNLAKGYNVLTGDVEC